MSGSEFYSFTSQDAFGNDVKFSELRGKVVLIVNVASLCGYTPQYKQLQLLHTKYGDRGLVILGFPCNQFANQEPEDEETIARFCESKFGVTFTIMNKISVNGPSASPIYKWLKKQKKGALGFMGVRWNFEKFLIDKNGLVSERYLSETVPLNFEHKIVQLLEQSV